MAFKAIVDKSRGSNLPSAEEFFADNEEVFADGDFVEYIRKIDLTERGYRLSTSCCTVFCSYKFWSMAKLLKAYIKGLHHDAVGKALMISISAPGANGYCDWTLGEDSGNGSKEAKTVIGYSPDGELEEVTFIQPECSSQWDADSWTYNSYQPDPTTPKAKKPATRTKKTATAPTATAE